MQASTSQRELVSRRNGLPRRRRATPPPNPAAVAALEASDPWLEARLMHQSDAWSACDVMGARFLFHVLRAYIACNPEGCPSQNYLARTLGASPRSIRRWTRMQEAAGLITTRIVEPGETNALGQIAELQNVHYALGPAAAVVVERAASWAQTQHAAALEAELAACEPVLRAQLRAELEAELATVHRAELERRDEVLQAMRAELEAARQAPPPRILDPEDPMTVKDLEPSPLEPSGSPSLSALPPTTLKISPPKAWKAVPAGAADERTMVRGEEQKPQERDRELATVAKDVVSHHQRIHFPDAPPAIPASALALVVDRLAEGFTEAFLKRASIGAMRNHGAGRSLWWMFGKAHSLGEHEHFYQATQEADHWERERLKKVQNARIRHGNVYELPTRKRPQAPPPPASRTWTPPEGADDWLHKVAPDLMKKIGPPD